MKTAFKEFHKKRCGVQPAQIYCQKLLLSAHTEVVRTFGTAIFPVYKKDIVGHSRTGIKTAGNFLGFNVNFFPQEICVSTSKNLRDYSGIPSFYLTTPQYFCNVAGCFCLYFKTMSVHFMQPMNISLQMNSMKIHVPLYVS